MGQVKIFDHIAFLCLSFHLIKIVLGDARFTRSAFDQVLEEIPSMGYSAVSHDSTLLVVLWLVALKCYEHFNAMLVRFKSFGYPPHAF